MIYKLFFENISGLLRIFTNKDVNFKLIISPIQDEKDNNKKNKITYCFVKNILNFPNNIKQIFTEFSFLNKNLDYPFFINKNLNFTLQISDSNAIVSESIIINYNDILNIQTNKNEKYNSNKKKNNDVCLNNDDEDINELLEFYIKNKNEDEDEFIFEIE
jgi:UDP-N-acetylglucosamine 2-epimerase